MMRTRAGISRGATVLVALSIMLAAVPAVRASSHREAPMIANDPLCDNTDLYAFVSPESGKSDKVVILANFIPLTKPESGPNFWYFADDAHYDINVDDTGTAEPNIIFRFIFSKRG